MGLDVSKTVRTGSYRTKEGRDFARDEIVGRDSPSGPVAQGWPDLSTGAPCKISDVITTATFTALAPHVDRPPSPFNVFQYPLIAMSIVQ